MNINDLQKNNIKFLYRLVLSGNLSMVEKWNTYEQIKLNLSLLKDEDINSDNELKLISDKTQKILEGLNDPSFFEELGRRVSELLSSDFFRKLSNTN